MGSLHGDDLARESVARRLPILRSLADLAMFDKRPLHRTAGRPMKR